MSSQFVRLRITPDTICPCGTAREESGRCSPFPPPIGEMSWHNTQLAGALCSVRSAWQAVQTCLVHSVIPSALDP